MRSSDRPALVTTEHNGWGTHRAPTRLLNRWTIRWDDATFCVTDEVRESMSGPTRSRARTLRHGIDVDAVAAATASRTTMRESLGVDDGTFLVGTVANFREQKDYPNLLRAARRVLDRTPHAAFVAVGQGPLEAEIRKLHSDLDLGDRFVLTGFRDDAVDVMAACDGFVLASRWEGLPVAVMEALALGLPLVATDVGGVHEQFHDGVDALLVPPGNAQALADALERLVADPALASRLAERGRSRASDFDVGVAAREIESTYRAVAGGGDGHSDDVARPPQQPSAAPTDRPGRSMSVEIRPATAADRIEIIELLAQTLGADPDERYARLFAWKHDDNPFGRSPMWVAVDGGEVVAFRTFMRWEFVRGGTVLRAARAVDTATRPDHQGRGLFRQLTLHGLDELDAEGVDFVFNTPNDQSRPGYLSMGWQEIGRLPASVTIVDPSLLQHPSRLRVPAERWSEQVDIGVPAAAWLDGGGLPAVSEDTDVRGLVTHRTDEFLAWRFGPDWLGYRAVEDDAGWLIARVRRRGPAREFAVVATGGERTDRLARRAARAVDATHVVRLGQPGWRSGALPLPGGGPILTWRRLRLAAAPPLPNWRLQLSDIELF